MDPQFEIECQILAQSIDGMDYYQILKIAQGATGGEIKRAYYQESRAFHPDKFYHLPDDDLKLNVHKIYKRITEAYTILRDAEARAKYTADINGPERASKLRYTEASEAELKKAKEEETGKTPQARQCYREATLAMQQKRWQHAERQLNMALMYEPGNTLFKEKLEEVRKNLKGSSSGGFSIR
ncbi:MAG: DnaJ domain-containing protein [Deltaproteobacteria bacterium]|nr:DnaJ domain-containing protein [Deltaproteobacteria bacterium]